MAAPVQKKAKEEAVEGAMEPGPERYFATMKELLGACILHSFCIKVAWFLHVCFAWFCAVCAFTMHW